MKRYSTSTSTSPILKILYSKFLGYSGVVWKKNRNFIVFSQKNKRSTILHRGIIWRRIESSKLYQEQGKHYIVYRANLFFSPLSSIDPLVLFLFFYERRLLFMLYIDERKIKTIFSNLEKVFLMTQKFDGEPNWWLIN